MRSLYDIYDVCWSYLKNLYDVCRYLTFVVDVEIDVATLSWRNDNSECCEILDVCRANIP